MEKPGPKRAPKLDYQVILKEITRLYRTTYAGIAYKSGLAANTLYRCIHNHAELSAISWVKICQEFCINYDTGEIYVPLEGYPKNET